MDTDEFHDKVIDGIAYLRSDLKGVHNRLDKVNGSVARHEQEINGLRVVDAQLLTNFTKILEDYKESKDNRKQVTTFWYERIAWIILMLAAALLTKTGILNL